MAKSTQIEPQFLNEFLEFLTLGELKSLAKEISLNPPIHKLEFMEAIAEVLLNAEKARKVWQGFNEIEQNYIAELVYSPTRQVDPKLFNAKYGQLPEYDSKIVVWVYGGILPIDLRDLLLSFVPRPDPARLQTVAQLPETVEISWTDYTHYSEVAYVAQKPLMRQDMERLAFHDVHTVLQVIDLGKIKASDKTKRVGTAGIVAIAQGLQGGDFYLPETEAKEGETGPGYFKAFAWPMLLQAAGLVELSGTKLQLSDAGKKALNQPAYEIISKIWKAWLKTAIFDEMNRIEKIKGQMGQGKRTMTAPSGRRRVIVQALQQCPCNEWVSFNEFSRFMQASGQLFEVTRDLWSLSIEGSSCGNLIYNVFEDWIIMQHSYLLAFLFEYVATLGLIDVAYIEPSHARLDFRQLSVLKRHDILTRYDGLLYFRLNNLGAWCLGLLPKYTPSTFETKQILKVLPNLDIVMLQPLPPSEVMFLDRFAQKTADAVWQLQPIKLLEGVESGLTVQEVRQFLAARSRVGLPNTVEIMLNELEERLNQLSDRGMARVIEVQEAALAQLIANETRLKKLCSVTNERYLVVPAEGEVAFRRALRELGYAVAR